MTSKFPLRILSTLAISFAFAAAADAQATRTWVSGTGDDANPCSRTAPCKTFAGAISKTAIGGEIDVIDAGGFGAITINKSLTIDGAGTSASILASGTQGVVVNATGAANVVLRNLSINGTGTTLGTNGINFINGTSVTVEHCKIMNFSQQGIKFTPTNAGTLTVTDTQIENCAVADLLSSATNGVNRVSISNSVFSNSAGFGVKSGANSELHLSHCSLSRNAVGVSADGNSLALAVLEHCTVTNNDTGVQALNSGGAVLSDTNVSLNSTGLSYGAGSQIVSFGQNSIGANATNGSPSGSLPLQ